MIKVDTAAALVSGGEALLALGFNPTGKPRTWEGRLEESGEVPMFVELPAGFPYELPIVSVSRPSLRQQVPHVERSGKVCIAAANGLLLDAARPQLLVQEAIQRARGVVGAGLRGENAADLSMEFGAYWEESGARDLLSFCDVNGPPRVIAVGEVAKGRKGPAFFAAETPERLRTIIARLGIKLGTVEPAWVIRLESPIAPPLFDEETDLNFVGRLIRESVDPARRREIEHWTNRDQGRLTFLFSFAIPNGLGEAVFALRLRSTLPSNGFRTGKVPLGVAIARSGRAVGERLSLQRADVDFLRSRTGAAVDLKDKNVLVVGCGAIGGYLATCLADSGVGALTLLDHDTLRAENAMRHVTGLAHVGSQKVVALKKFLQSRLPHVEIDARDARLENALAEEPDIARRHDLVLLATGDQTLELRMSDSLRRDARLVHTWVEAHGVGGHVLVDGHTEKGCLGCLVVADDVHGLRCPASLYAPGQDFSLAVGGCAGTFTPFGSLDAQRAAIEATRVALRVLLGELHTSTLVTWFEPSPRFHNNDLVLSDRARLLVPGSRTEVTAHAGCPRCMT